MWRVEHNGKWRDDPVIGPVVVSEADLRRRVGELGIEIEADYAERPPLLVGVLKGAFVFMSDLARAIRLPVEVDVMAVASYGAGTSTSGVVRIVKDLDTDLTGRHVLVVEDIVDSGLTSVLSAQQPSRPPAGEPRGVRAAREGGSSEHRLGPPICRLPNSCGFRGRLRARCRREVQEPPRPARLHRRRDR